MQVQQEPVGRSQLQGKMALPALLILLGSLSDSVGTVGGSGSWGSFTEKKKKIEYENDACVFSMQQISYKTCELMVINFRIKPIM